MKLITSQVNFNMIRPIYYRTLNKRSPRGVRTPPGRSLSGPLVQKQSYDCKARSYFFSPEEQLAPKFKNWCSLESYGSVKNVEFNLVRKNELRKSLNQLPNIKLVDGQLDFFGQRINRIFQKTIEVCWGNLDQYREDSVKMVIRKHSIPTQ